MELSVEHDTIYRYAEPQRYTIQYIRLTPNQTAHQTVWRWAVTAPGRMHGFVDGFGNPVQVLSITEPHQGFTVSVRGRVSTRDTGGILPGDSDPLPVRAFARPTTLTAPSPELRALIQGHDGRSRAGLEALAHGIRDRIEYRTGETHAASPAAAVLRHGSGVCQDHAHIFIACCRILGVAARYVSGYYWTGSPGEDYEANHAWAEAWVDGVGWVGFDVSNRAPAGESYLRLACGMDYLDAAPMRGVRRGAGNEEMTVRVRVTSGQEQQQQ